MALAAARRMSATARREQLLDAAKALVAEHGFHGVSIEAVARAAGITRPIVYRHFDDLPALLDALVERETLRALVQLDAVLPADVGDLIAAFDGYLRAVRGDPVTWRLVLVPPEGAPALLRERSSWPPPSAPAAGSTRSSPPTRSRPSPTPAHGSCSPIPSASRPSGCWPMRGGCFPAARQNDLGMPQSALWLN
jgi:AcrR family transcriptional regulator